MGAAGVGTILWATGYRPDFSWVGLPFLEPDGYPHQRRGVTVTERPWTNESTVDAVAATRRHLQRGTLALLDQAELVRELISLEQHPLPSGRPRIAAPSGGTDDNATALLALVAELAGKDSLGRVPFGAAA
jgi:hypothetical protein